MTDKNLWYRVGYTLERARGRTTAPEKRPLRSLAERLARRKLGRDAEGRPAGGGNSARTGEPWEAAFAASGIALAVRALERAQRRRRPGFLRLLRAGAAGAGAGLFCELVRPVVTGKPRETPFAHAARRAALSGVARGLTYGALVEPNVPGPSIARGAAYGLVEHFTSPWGGLTVIAGRRGPHRLPILADLFEDPTTGTETLGEHLAFGMTLSVLHGATGCIPRVRRLERTGARE